MKSITNNVAKGQSTKSYKSLVRNPNPNKQTTHTWWIKQTTSMNKKSINESIEKRVRKDLFNVLKTKWISEKQGMNSLVVGKLDKKLDRAKQWPLNYIYDLKNIQGLIMQIGKSFGANFHFSKLDSVIDFSGPKPVSIDTLDWIWKWNRL